MPIYTDKQTKRLYIQFDFEGRTYRKRLPKGILKREANKLETKMKNELFFASNEMNSTVDITFEDFLTRYFLPMAENNHSKRTFYRDVEVCKKALELFRGKNMREIKPADIEKFKSITEKIMTQRGTKKKPATIVRELSVLSTVFSEAVNNDFIDYNPCSRVKKPSFDNTQNRVLRYEDEEKFFAAFRSDWAKEICILVLNTGLRNNDALKLSKSHIDWNREMICLTQGKTQRRVEIPMNETVQRLIRSKWDNKGELLFPNPRTGKLGTSVKRAMTGASIRAGIEHLTIRDLRRTFGTRLDELNYSSSVKAKLLGHGDLRSVHRYELGSKILRDAVLELEKKNPAKILPKDKTGAVLDPVNKGVEEGNPTKILPESERAYEQFP